MRTGPITLGITALVTALLVGGVAFSAGRISTAGSAHPDDTSAAAGFARDMQVHHNQGVELAMIVRDRTEDPEVRLLAYDIAITQSQQSGQAYGWLSEWGLSQAGGQPPMAWMSGSGSGESMSGEQTPMPADSMPTNSMSADMPMPGLATAAQIAQLKQSSGVEAEKLFLSLMIAHHKAAIEMAKAVLERTDYPTVTAYADAVVKSQTAEITVMKKMLAERQ